MSEAKTIQVSTTNLLIQSTIKDDGTTTIDIALPSEANEDEAVTPDYMIGLAMIDAFNAGIITQILTEKYGVGIRKKGD